MSMGINAVSANSINILSGNQISTKQAGSETQEKTGQADKEITEIANQFDHMEITPESQTAIPSDNYSNIRLNFVNNSIFRSGTDLHRHISECMKKYSYEGFSDEELKKDFISTCKEWRLYKIQKGQITENNPKDDQKLISRIYSLYQFHNANWMSQVCMDAGKSISSQYGDNDIGYVYYDTDYRDRCESTHTFLKEIAEELAKEWQAPSIDYVNVENDARESSLLSGMDFEECWNYYARGRNMCSLKDIKNPDFIETVSSGERFSFFYKAVAAPGREGENTLETQKGVILLELGERKWKLDVPFNNSTVLGDLAYNFNVGSLFERYANDNPVMLRLLKHFNVFSLFCRRDII
ncbi:MAG: hypothetical protein IJ661_00520 [Lachnospiraceae bacterium]|nr:hypothetical protein [Lachnospiraceae bacterium]